jgi:hypothetical protein
MRITRPGAIDTRPFSVVGVTSAIFTPAPNVWPPSSDRNDHWLNVAGVSKVQLGSSTLIFSEVAETGAQVPSSTGRDGRGVGARRSPGDDQFRHHALLDVADNVAVQLILAWLEIADIDGGLAAGRDVATDRTAANADVVPDSPTVDCVQPDLSRRRGEVPRDSEVTEGDLDCRPDERDRFRITATS